jgi:hydroxymethylpyrimidine pyrophosphatase-like HAD family hydrolase
VRLVACDLDGTLLRRDGSVSPRTRAAWSAATRAGIEMVIVTARPPRYLDVVAAELACTGTAICANGALRYDLGARRVTAVRPLAREVTEAVVAAVSVAVPGVGFAVETGVMVVFEPGFTRPNHGGDLRLAAADLAELWHHGTPIVKLLAWSATCTADHLLTLVRTAAGEAVECTHSGGTGLVEVSAAGVSKLAALIDLCAEREVPAAQVVAFGDMPNDLAMLTWAGRGYAVANAHPSVLAAGLPTTASNDDDGVARILESLLDGSFPGHG